ncbi:MAG TPA: 3-isopropylmalate dehydratase small subunit [Nitrososphaerales archaeon]|nr:3-isopropylmalate dehydratase small subunit [Nitrososphaerales archaeon]
MTGKAWKFGENISTDEISPGRYMSLRSNLPELAKHTLEDARNDFPSGVKQGDYVVAGKNFGMGSSREQAPLVIKMVGVRAVIANSFARIFYRNAINIGLPAVVLDTSVIDEGDVLDIDLSGGRILNLTKKQELVFPKMSKTMEAILNEGGLLAYVEKYGDLQLA